MGVVGVFGTSKLEGQLGEKLASQTRYKPASSAHALCLVVWGTWTNNFGSERGIPASYVVISFHCVRLVTPHALTDPK